MKEKFLSRTENFIRHLLSGSDSKVQTIGYRLVFVVFLVIFV